MDPKNKPSHSPQQQNQTIDTSSATIKPDELNRILAIQSHLIDADFNLSDFMDLVVNEMQTLTPATGVVLELVSGDYMVYRAATGTVQEYIGLKLPIKNSISGLCVESHEILQSEDTEVDSRVNIEACRRVKARSLVVAPLFHEGQAVGVLKILSEKPRAFNDSHIKILQLMAGFLGSALFRQVLHEIRNFY